MRELHPDLVYTRAEAQEILRLSRGTIEHLLRNGSLAASKIGAMWRIQGRDIIAYLEAGKESQQAYRNSLTG